MTHHLTPTRTTPGVLDLSLRALRTRCSSTPASSKPSLTTFSGRMAEESTSVRTWECSCLAPPSPSTSCPSSGSSSALIILNTPIASTSTFRRLWDHADVRICADGGANRLHDLIAASSSSEGWLPDSICGDLDSLEPDVGSYFKSKGVEIIEDEDQYCTDLGKCLSLLLPLSASSHKVTSPRLADKKGKVRKVTVHGGLAGRLDQTVHTLHTLMALEEGTDSSVQSPPYQWWTSRSERQRLFGTSSGFPESQSEGGKEEFWVVDTDAQSAACCLNSGRHRIRVGWKSSSSSLGKTDAGSGKTRPRTCGILPIGIDKAVISTKGLTWDLGSSLSLIAPASAC